MAKGLFILGFFVLLSYNVFLFGENRRLSSEIDVLRAEVSYDKNKSESADGLVKFADFITQKSLEGLRE
jgi:hypothetical protein